MKIFHLLVGLILTFTVNHKAQSQLKNSTSIPILSCRFDNNELSNDSLINGVEGHALYFTPDKGKNGLLITEQQNIMSSLWAEKDFTIEVWVKTTADNKEFQVIASNKDWNSGTIKDFTDNRYFGFSRISGVNKGWAIMCQPDGSWAWNIGNGKHDGKEVRVESFRKDYRPTAPRQKINDGQWHQIAFSINRTSNEARLYFDGQNVATYFMGPVKDLNAGLPMCLGNDPLLSESATVFDGAIDEFKVYDRVLTTEEIAQRYQQLVPEVKFPQLSDHPIDQLNVMSWNIWHGGRRRGREIGPKQVINLIKETNTDIVMMQETYGSGPLIADALGYYFYLSSANISVISKYPIEKTWVAYHELWSGITNIRISEQQSINLASIWLHYLPGWGGDFQKPDATPEKLIAGEKKNRHKEIKIILNTLASEIANADSIPLIIGGDFNSPSHLDWLESNKEWHNNLVVDWPVSKEMHKAGFKDSFREMHPTLNYSSPSISSKDLTFRIDYIYYKGKGIKAKDSDMFFRYKGAWPSDHPAVITTFKFNN